MIRRCFKMRQLKLMAFTFVLLAGHVSSVAAEDLVSEFMCPCPDLCGKALQVCECSDAGEYIMEIKDMQAHGLSSQAIRDKLVEKYGPTVLASPPARGFGLLAYLLPPMALVLGIGIATALVKKWSRRTRPAQIVSPAELKQTEELLKKWKS